MNIYLYTQTPPEYGKQMNKASRTHIRIRRKKKMSVAMVMVISKIEIEHQQKWS